MEEILKEIIQKNDEIRTALNGKSSEQDLKCLLDGALEAQEKAKSIGFTSSTAYDLLVYNIEALKERLGIQEEKPKALTPDVNRSFEGRKVPGYHGEEQKKFNYSVRDQEFYDAGKEPTHGRGRH